MADPSPSFSPGRTSVSNARPAPRWRLPILLLGLAMPRAARMAFPQVWIEDESYLNLAFLLAGGDRPYLDFPLPHFPLLEALAALAFRVFPASISTAEGVTQAAAYGASVLVFVLGRRIAGTATGVAAAVIFATSPLLFRYHLFPREMFGLLPVLATAVMLVGHPVTRPLRRRDVAIMALLLTAALSVKLTAVAAVLGVSVHLAWRARDVRAAWPLLGWTAALTGLVAAGLLAAFGSPFVVQVLLFRWLHPSFPSLGVKLAELGQTLDLSLAFGFAGLLWLTWAARVRAWTLPVLMLASAVLVVVLLNPTYWAHAGIELLPWLSLLAGALVAETWRTWSRPGPERTRSLTSAGLGVWLAVLVVPVGHQNPDGQRTGPPGFGYRDRAEIADLARAIREHTSPGDRVAAPPLIAFAANRREVVPYPEVAGTMMALNALVETDGLLGAVGHTSMRRQDVWERIVESGDAWLPRLAQAIQTHEARVVVNFSPDDLFPVLMIDVPAETLEKFGYTVLHRTAHYTAWMAPPPP